MLAAIARRPGVLFVRTPLAEADTGPEVAADRV
jgi:hypothetical protein